MSYGVQQPGREGVYYADYLMLDELFQLQKPVTASKGREAHNEHMFIVIHQTYELWFKQILHELNAIITAFENPVALESSLNDVVNNLDRIIAILKLLVEQITMVEKIHPLEFLEFRDDLNPASGFQSLQFRILENRLGLAPESRIQHQKSHYHSFFAERHQVQLQKVEKMPNLLALVTRWLEQLPYLARKGYDFWETYRDTAQKIHENEVKQIQDDKQLPADIKEHIIAEMRKTHAGFTTIFDESKFNERKERGDVKISYKAMQAAVFINVYRDLPFCHIPHRILSMLVDIDELIAKWRFGHSLMVQRMIGAKMGSAGSSGYHYLRATVSDRYKVFLDFYNIASYFIAPQHIPALPLHLQQSMDFTWHDKSQ